MNDCNVRGFLQLDSDNDVAVVSCPREVTSHHKLGRQFSFNRNFDAIQNIKFTSDVCLPVFLRQGSQLQYLGTTEYLIFPNTSVPQSFPFFLFKDTAERYLLIPCGEQHQELTISVTYEGVIFKKKFQTLFDKNSFEYVSFPILDLKKSQFFRKIVKTKIFY